MKIKTIAKNKKALRDYKIIQKFRAGIILSGNEVKSVKQGKVSLKGSFVKIQGGIPFLINAHISPYQPKNTPQDYNPLRSRQLLMRKAEIKSLLGRKGAEGLTFIPLRIFSTRGLIKLEFALARGLKKYDKREKIKKKEFQRRKLKLEKAARRVAD